MAYRLVLLSIVLAACSGGSATRPAPAPPAPAPAPPPVAQPSPEEAARKAALAELARLIAEADKAPLLAPWTGPYGGVPPWDQARARRVPAPRSSSASRCARPRSRRSRPTRRRRPSRTRSPRCRTPAATSGRAETLFRVMTEQPERPRGPGGRAASGRRSSTAAERRDHLQRPAVRADHGGARRRAESAGLTAEQQRLVERTYDRFVRAGARLDAGAEAAARRDQPGARRRCSPSSATRCSPTRTPGSSLDKAADLAGPARLDCVAALQGRRGRAQARRASGRWSTRARASIRSSTSSTRARPAREGLEGVQEPRRQRRRQRHQRDDRADRQAARRARAAARLRRRTRTGAWPTRWRRTRRRRAELMMQVWPAAVARVQRGGRRHAGDRRRRTAPTSRSSRGTTSTTPRRCARRSTTSIRTSSSRTSSSNNMIAAAFCMAEQLYGLDVHARSPARCRCSTPTCASGRSRTRRAARYVGLFYGDYFARAGKRSGAWASGYRGHETFTGTTRHADHVEQQQLRARRAPASRC